MKQAELGLMQPKSHMSNDALKGFRSERKHPTNILIPRQLQRKTLRGKKNFIVVTL
jgi:hypothetical protein